MSHRSLARLRSALILGLVAFPVLLASCGSNAGATEISPETILARDHAADFFARPDKKDFAREALRPLVARRDAAGEDLLRAALVELADESNKDSDPVTRARPFVERAAALVPADDPVLRWCRYRLAAVVFDNPQAVVELRPLLASRPDDFLVELALATALDDQDEPAAETEAQQHYRHLLALPPEITGAWRMAVLLRLANSLQRDQHEEEAKGYFDEFKLLDARKVKNPGNPAHQPGTLGAMAPHTQTAREAAAPKAPASAFEEQALAGAGEVSGIAVVQLDWKTEPAPQGLDELFTWQSAARLVRWGARLTLQDLAGAAPQTILDQPIVALLPFDRMNHGADKSSDAPEEKRRGDRDLDLLVVSAAGDGSELRLLENVEGKWSLRPEPLARLPALDASDRLTAVDYDHDGDIDVLVAGPKNLLLLRNDGLDGSGGLTDATAEAGLPAGDFRVTTDDFDNLNDVDFLLVERGSGAVHLASNKRGGRFADATASLPKGLAGRWVVAADFDGDGWTDLAVLGDDLALYTRTALGGWRAEPRRFALAHGPTGEPRAVDWDLDGTYDLVWPCAETPAAGVLAPGFRAGGLAFTLGAPFRAPVEGASTLLVDDLDGDHDLDLLRLDARGLYRYSQKGAGQGIAFVFQGHKDNARGIGALIELRAGLGYRRIYYRGSPELVGFDGAKLDELRISWPNGIVQGNFGFDPGTSWMIAQRLGQVGSCPFLYTWNGKSYEFVSDVLGITPLGLPMGPDMLVPPDHDEYVLVKGEQLVPKDGVYEMQLTEELREVTYLDRIRLDVVDHPADTEIFPNERFSFPPFPEAHTHTVKDPLVPLSATDQSGKDWTRELAANDKRFAIPFEPLAGPYRGLATPYTLELAFDKQRLKSAAKLRLFLNGWFYWTDASVNMAVARHPDFEFIPPILSVPDGNGGWKECGDIGFPAGKLKTMEFDVSELLNRDDPRIRLFSTLRLYWDSIRLAVDADDAPLVTTAIEPSSAKLWERGFSRSHALLGAHDCEWFTWDELEDQPRWNQHPGMYTKLGETVPLLADIDDRFVILGAGDALTVHFDATRAPPLKPGWRRDFLVFLDGWAKDRDPNTIEALYVEPLPFHGMSGYPYRPDEHYPDDEAHRAYRREWNTRPAKRWIPALVPPRFEELESGAAHAIQASAVKRAPTSGS